jgi:hypothetical protein
MRFLIPLLAALGLCGCPATSEFVKDTVSGAADSAKSATQSNINQKTSEKVNSMMNGGN